MIYENPGPGTGGGTPLPRRGDAGIITFRQPFRAPIMTPFTKCFWMKG